ncbi:MAG: SDR family NAD(P)-dependent oxidoreductase [Pseudomonadota bacterium]
MGRLAGKVAVITGATTGIGAGSAEVFAREGAKVVLAGRNAERGEAVAAKIGADALFVQTDVSDEAQVKALVDRAVDHFGRIDCLFSNAGSAGPGGPLADLDFDKVRGAMDVLIGGVLAGIKHAAPVMRDQGGGSIIATASIAGHQVGYGPS